MAIRVVERCVYSPRYGAAHTVAASEQFTNVDIDRRLGPLCAPKLVERGASVLMAILEHPRLPQAAQPLLPRGCRVLRRKSFADA
jgi:hypothetical protein